MTTVSPVLGEQIRPGREYPYEDYYLESVKAAEEENVIIADSGYVMRRKLDGLNEEEKRNMMFADM